MKRAHAMALIISLGVISGCVPSKEEYEAIVTTLQGSAKARQFAVAECTKGFTPELSRKAAIVIDSSVKDAPRVACTRFVQAMKTGRVDYNDIVNIKRRKFTPKLVKVRAAVEKSATVAAE